jgi:hypothetical protein
MHETCPEIEVTGYNCTAFALNAANGEDQTALRIKLH